MFGAPATGELAWARQLMRVLDDSMLVLADRGFDDGAFMAAVAATRAQFLIRLQALQKWVVSRPNQIKSRLRRVRPRQLPQNS